MPTASLDMPTLDDGREMARPAARHSISIRQPLPTCSRPPITISIGTKTSSPLVGPFWKTAFSGQ
ncbi:hypothetical protein D3C80_1227760 [compost metagenome]